MNLPLALLLWCCLVRPVVGQPNELTLVKDGQPASLIVTKSGPNESQVQAASELQDHIRVMSGAELPIVEEKHLAADDTRSLILVGPSERARKLGVEFKGLAPESFIVKTCDNSLILAGEDGGRKSNARTGTLWAVYDFLQDQLGCRWIWPGEIGRVIPKRRTIVVGSLDVQETPRIKIRHFRGVNQDKHRVGYESEGLGRLFDLTTVYDQIAEDERVWMQRMRLGSSFNLSYGHAFTDWWEKHKDSEPDIFALLPNGRRGPAKRDKPDFVKMCVSNPRLWELQLEPLRRNSQEGARGQWVNCCENDGSAGFCTCARCRAWDVAATSGAKAPPRIEDGSDAFGASKPDTNIELPESLSDRYARWYNEVARQARAHDPDARVIAYAYSRYRSPPSQVERIEPNVWIGYVGFNAYPRPDDYLRTAKGEWLGWSQLGATIFLRSNSLFYCGEGAPHVASHAIADDLKFQIAHGLQATDFDCLQGHWAATGPTYYLLARMLWDAEADPERVLDEFYGSFGPMSTVVKEYFEYWETFTTALGDNSQYFGLNRTEKLQAHPRFYTDAVFDKAQQILARAQQQLQSAAPDERERFHNIELGLEHARLLVAALKDGKTSNGVEGERLMAFRRQIAPRNVVNVYWTTSKEKRYRVFE